MYFSQPWRRSRPHCGSRARRERAGFQGEPGSLSYVPRPVELPVQEPRRLWQIRVKVSACLESNPDGCGLATVLLDCYWTLALRIYYRHIFTD